MTIAAISYPVFILFINQIYALLCREHNVLTFNFCMIELIYLSVV